MLTTALLAAALHAPPNNVAANWPTIVEALRELGITAPESLAAAAATIGVECPTFTPRCEQFNGDPHVYFARYDGRKDLGNTQPGDGYKFRGRGYVQITGRANYARYGALLGTDLVSNPDRVLDPNTAAAVFAAFFYERGIDKAARRSDWPGVRRAVNGGLNGYAEFLHYVTALTHQ